MKTKLVNVRFPLELYMTGMDAVAEGSYANFQEFIKDAVRHSVQESKRDQALFNLCKNFGSTKGKARKPFTKEIKEQIAEGFAKQIGKQKELFKRANL